MPTITIATYTTPHTYLSQKHNKNPTSPVLKLQVNTWEALKLNTLEVTKDTPKECLFLFREMLLEYWRLFSVKNWLWVSYSSRKPTAENSIDIAKCVHFPLYFWCSLLLACIALQVLSLLWKLEEFYSLFGKCIFPYRIQTKKYAFIRTLTLPLKSPERSSRNSSLDNFVISCSVPRPGIIGCQALCKTKTWQP